MLQCEVQCELSITDEEKQQLLVAAANFSLDNRPFLASLFSCLDYSDNDYFQLFALCLFYAMQVTCDSIWNFWGVRYFGGKFWWIIKGFIKCHLHTR